MKVHTITVLLFILLVNSVFHLHGRVIAGPPIGGWEDLHNPSVPGGQVNFLVRAPSNPDILYADLTFPYTSYENQMLYQSQDDGQTWQDTHNSKLAVSALAVDAKDPNILYGTEFGGLIRSVDGGSTWWPFYSFGFDVAAPSPGRIYLLGRTTSTRCLYGNSYEFARSLDSGLTWLRIPVACDTQYPNRMFVNPNNPDQIFLSGNGQSPITYTSLDGGLTWHVLEINSIPLGIVDIVFDPDHPGRLFLATWDSALWTSEDDGITWSACGERSATATYPYLLQFSQGNLYVIDQALDLSDHRWHIYRSQDQCASWWKSMGGLPSFAKAFLANPNSSEKLVAATEGYGIFRSGNSGSTWQESNTGVFSPAVVNQLALAPGDPNVILAGGFWPRPALYRSMDGGLSWSTQILDAQAVSLLLDPADPQKAWMATYTGIFFSTDGVTWSQNYSGPEYINELALSAADPGHPYAAAGGDGQQGYVFHWGSCALDCSYSYWIPRPISGSSFIREIAVNPIDGQDILAGGYSISATSSNSMVYRSTNGGQSWHEVLRNNYINQVQEIAIDPSNPSVRYLLVDQMGILRSQNSGESWESWPGSVLHFSVGSKLEVDDFGGVYLFTSLGIYYRGVFDADWTPLPAPFQNATTGAFWRSNSPFLISGGWGGLYRLNLPTIRKLWLPFLGK